MIALVDNDALVKVAALDMLLEIDGLLDASSVKVLTSAQRVLTAPPKKQAIRSQIGSDGYDRLQQFLAKAKTLKDSPPPRLISDLVDVAIDPGEAVLFATAAEFGFYLVATGDKRAIEAISKDQGAKILFDGLSGRVICFEQILLNAIELLGFADVRKRAIAVLGCDGALAKVFAEGARTSEADAIARLEEYVASLRERSGRLLQPNARTSAVVASATAPAASSPKGGRR